MKQLAKQSPKAHAKSFSKTRPNKAPINIEDTTFFKKKMAKGEKMLSLAGLPKIA